MGSILNHILTDPECYTTIEPHAPIGLRHHKCMRPPTTSSHDTPQVYAVRTHRPHMDSAIRQSGQWSICEGRVKSWDG
ncbi:hypothetical protein E2C01_074560 [Portunus trituberculatus]|uniref:Uncharacterized protein n=1 Tax=Portunus trituberculatus TaxID=210409 RepID=A0A5B7IGL1_PORTR|nr:hypothetical protein [Portunus trituberculatus]